MQTLIECSICHKRDRVDDRIVSGEAASDVWQVSWVSDSKGKRNEIAHNECLMGKQTKKGGNGNDSDD